MKNKFRNMAVATLVSFLFFLVVSGFVIFVIAKSIDREEFECDPKCKKPQICSEVLRRCFTPPKVCDPACKEPFKCMKNKCILSSIPTQSIYLNSAGLLTPYKEEAAIFQHIKVGGVERLLVDEQQVGAAQSESGKYFWRLDQSKCEIKENTSPHYSIELKQVPNFRQGVFYIAANDKWYLIQTKFPYYCPKRRVAKFSSSVKEKDFRLQFVKDDPQKRKFRIQLAGIGTP